MSYILDALKRADAERERGHVPGLHSQSASLSAPAPRAGQRRKRPTLAPMTAAAVLLLVAAAAVWWWLSAPDREARPTVAVPPPATAPDPQPPTAAAPPADVVEAPTASPAAALPILAPAPVRTPSATSAPGAPGPVTSPPPGAPPAATPPASAPPVKVSGATYSENPSHRMLIVNGKVVLEGQEIEPGLTVEVISPRSAILNHRGSRYNINY